MSDDTYNGWKNKPTWLVNVYFGDDTEWIEELIYSVPVNETFTLTDLADAIENYIDEYVGNLDLPDRIDNGFIGDLFGWALAHVDWRKLAESWASDIDGITIEEIDSVRQIVLNA